MKKEDISDAVNMLSDEILEETEKVRNGKAGKRRGLKWGALAACLVIVGAVALMPHITDSLSSGNVIYLKEAAESAKEGGNTDADTDAFKIVLTDKTTAKVKRTDKAVKDNSAYSLVWFSEEEMFDREEMFIFRGRISALDNIEIDFKGDTSYRCIATVSVDKVYKGDVREGGTVRMLLPCPAPLPEEIMWIEDTEVITQIRDGMEGIFMPWSYDEENSYWEQNGRRVMLSDLAPCGLADGVRWVFLDTENGLVFDKNSYEGAKDAKTLDDIEEYVLEMLK